MLEGHTMGFWVAFVFAMCVVIAIGIFVIGFLINMSVEDIMEWREKQRQGGKQ